MRPKIPAPLALVLLVLSVGLLGGCSSRALSPSSSELWFSPDAPVASVALDNDSSSAVTVGSVRVEGQNWDRFTIRSSTVSGTLEPGESLEITVEAEPQAQHGDGYLAYLESQAYLLIAHDETFSKIPMHIQPKPRPSDLAWRLAGWLGALVLAVVGVGLGGGRPLGRWASYSRASRGACILFACGIGLGGGRLGLCTAYASGLATRNDLQQCAAGRGGTALTLLDPGLAGVACVVALAWFASTLCRTDDRRETLSLAAAIAVVSYLAVPTELALAAVKWSGQPAFQPLVLGFASVIWVVGIALITAWTTRTASDQIDA